MVRSRIHRTLTNLRSVVTHSTSSVPGHPDQSKRFVDTAREHEAVKRTVDLNINARATRMLRSKPKCPSSRQAARMWPLRLSLPQINLRAFRVPPCRLFALL